MAPASFFMAQGKQGTEPACNNLGNLWPDFANNAEQLPLRVPFRRRIPQEMGRADLIYPPSLCPLFPQRHSLVLTLFGPADG